MTAPLTSRDIIIEVPSIEPATAFYERLGMTVFLREGTIVGLEAGAFRLFVEEGIRAGPVFEVFVADVDVAKADLVADGCTIVDDDPSIPRCYVRDPFGLTFNLAAR